MTHHTNGNVSYSHKVLTPVVVAPGNPRVLTLEPEFIEPKARTEKQDCELNAAKRWVERHAALAAKKVILLGDDLFSKDPFCKALLLHGFHFILVCKPESHKTLYEEVAAFERIGDRQTFSIHDFTTLTKYLFFESWSQLMAFMVEQLEIEPADTG